MKHFLICILMILIACNKQPSMEPNRLIITAISADFETKATETAFEAGDKIGVFLESSHGNNALYETTDGGTWRGYDNIYKVNPGEKATAYYPYSKSATNLNEIEISKNVDFMITSATPITLVNNKASVALQFKHVLSKLVVNIKKLEEINGVKIVSQDSVVVKSVYRKGTINLADGKITQLTDKGDLKAFGSEIIVIPMQTAQKIKLIFKMANGTFDSLAYNTPILLESGKKTTLNVTSNADLYFTSFLNLSSGEAQTDLPLSFYVAPGRTWTLTSSEPWLTFSATTGVGAATVKVKVLSNATYPLKPRPSILTLKDDKPSMATLKVLQNYPKIPTVEIAGTNWLTANLGGSNPQDYGNFYKWGSTYVYDRVSGTIPPNHWGGETTMAATFPTESISGHSGYDYVNLAGCPTPGDPCKILGAYRTPTLHQWQDLDAVKSIWTTLKPNAGANINGRLIGLHNVDADATITSVPDNCIFLPSTGYKIFYNGTVKDEIIRGCYWASSISGSLSCYYYNISEDEVLNGLGTNQRGYGFSVRCVATN